MNVAGTHTVGGMNHPTRTLYYHIQHLLRAGIQPLFIYDGPHKPRVKRQRYHLYSANYVPFEPPAASSLRTAAGVEREYDPQHVTHLSKQILDRLGIPWRIAPGEAEAECARLEQAGVVDAVLTKDGDAFVFGSSVVLQRLDAEGKTAVVRRFRTQDMKDARPQSLRQQDVLLLALMAGGDYDGGVPGCGPKVALEAARVGYSGELRALLLQGRSTRGWRDRLVEELRTNSKGRFSCRWVAVANAVPSIFPDPRIARYYFNPAVSPRDALEEYGSSVGWHQETDAWGLREWTAKYFDWKYAYHACEFVNNLTPALLARKLMIHSKIGVDGSYMVKAIHSVKPMSKNGDDTGDGDGDNESTLLLRVSYYPSTVIGIDVSGEPVVEGYKANMQKLFDPEKEAREWFPMWMLKKGAPTAFKSWQENSTKNTKQTPNKRIPETGPEETPAKRQRGRPRKEPLGSARVSGTPQRAETHDSGTTSNTPSIAVVKPDHASRNRDNIPASHRIAPRTSGGSLSRSSSPEFPELSTLFGSGRGTPQKTSYETPLHNDELRGGPRTSPITSRRRAVEVDTPSPNDCASKSQRYEEEDATVKQRAREGVYTNRRGSHAADVIDLTSALTTNSGGK